MTNGYNKLMDVLYFICVFIAGGALVIMTTIIAWGVFTRYALGSGSFWPEPISIFLAIQLTFSYSAIPIAGLITLLFVIEKVFFRPSIKDPEGSDV